MKIMLFAAASLLSVAAAAQTTVAPPAAPDATAATSPAPATAAPGAAHALPASTLVVVTPLQTLTSKHMKVGDKVDFATVNDVIDRGEVAIPRGTPVTGEITWKTGRAIGGKSGKFEVTFRSMTLGGRSYAMRSTYRQEGRGDSVGALLGSMVISGRSAVMQPGELVNIFTAEPVSY
ncbi:MAG: hypothetical protein ACTHMG_00205 [Sphingomonas sp.]